MNYKQALLLDEVVAVLVKSNWFCAQSKYCEILWDIIALNESVEHYDCFELLSHQNWARL